MYKIYNYFCDIYFIIFKIHLLSAYLITFLTYWFTWIIFWSKIRINIKIIYCPFHGDIVFLNKFISIKKLLHSYECGTHFDIVWLKYQIFPQSVMKFFFDFFWNRSYCDVTFTRHHSLIGNSQSRDSWSLWSFASSLRSYLC